MAIWIRQEAMRLGQHERKLESPCLPALDRKSDCQAPCPAGAEAMAESILSFDLSSRLLLTLPGLGGSRTFYVEHRQPFDPALSLGPAATMEQLSQLELATESLPPP